MGEFDAEPNEPVISDFCEIYNTKNINMLQKRVSKILKIQHA